METEAPGVLADIPFHVAELPLAAWPTRSRRLLQDLYALSVSWLHQRLQLGVDAYGQHLVVRAEHSRLGVDQQAQLDVRERLPQGFEQLRNTVIETLAERFAHIGTPTDPARTFAHTPSLTLVNPVQQETLATLESITARGNARGSLALVELGYRLAALVAKPPLEGADMPVSPHVLGHALYKGSLAMQLGDGQTLELLRQLEQALHPELTAFYARLNKHLRDDGLLPELCVYSASWLPDDAEDPDADDRVSDGATTASSHPEGADARAANAPEIPDTGPRNILDTLRLVLAQRHPRPPTAAASQTDISTEDLLQALAGLQRQVASGHQPPVALGNAQQLGTQLLKLIDSNRRDHTANPTLKPHHHDTLEIMAMLFAQLARQTRMGGSARAVLAGLQLPILRAALCERGFLRHDRHPAMQLLGAATDAANDWLDAPDSEPDPGLQDTLQALIDRANREPPSAALYTSLLADIDAHLHMLKRRAQVTERRHVEAMQGRDRLDRARQCASRLMAGRFAVAQPRGLLRALLDHAWTDVLALTVLRHGESSAALSQQLIITDQLLGQMAVNDPSQLQADVETGLAQIGMAADEASEVARHLLAADERASAASTPTNPRPTNLRPVSTMPIGTTPISATEMLVRLKSKQRFGATSTAATTPRAAAPAQYAALETHLRRLPCGTWFEFADADSHVWHRRKLAWFSPDTGQALFVNRRGQRARETSLAQLAAAIGEGRAREMALDTGGALDRAWQQLASWVRQANVPVANRAD